MRGFSWCIRALFLTVVPLFAAALPLAAQQGATTGVFRGRVADAEGRAVAGAQVVARNTATGVQRGAIVDADGRYVIPLLSPGGPYTLSVSSIGFQTQERAGLMLSAGNAITVDFQLAVEAVQVAGIEVLGNAARIDLTQGGVVTRVGQDQVDNLPVAGRDFVDFLNLSPLVSPQPAVGTGGQFSIGGMRTSGTNVQIDGADANNIYFGENRGSSRSPFAFSLESIKEFQLITNGYDVEYGSYQGGVVNAVTKSGTNNFDGTVFYFRRDERLTGKDFNGVKPTTYQVNQFGASVSGPVIRDRLHFFVSADVQRKDQPIYATVPGQSNTINQDSLTRVINALRTRYGVQNASEIFGQFEQEQNNLVLFGRADWAFNDKHRLTVRGNFSDFLQTNDRLSATESILNTGAFKDKAWSGVAELNSVFSDRAYNTFRFQSAYEDRPRPAYENGGYIPQFTVSRVQGTTSVFLGGDGTIFRNRLEESKLEFINNFNYRIGQHGLKVGGSVLLGNNVNTFWLAGNGLYTFDSLVDFEAGRPSRYTRNVRRCPVALTPNAAGERVICPEYDVPLAEFGFTEYAGYLQDDFQVTDRFLVTGGVRFTGTTFPDNPGEFAMVRDTFGYSTDHLPSFTGVSPRLSFTYDLGQQDRVLRGGIALLVGRAPTVLAGNAISTQRPLLSITCTAAEVPTINFQELLAANEGQANPAACRSGAAPTGRPEYTLFADGFNLPQTVKASAGYEHLFATNTKVGVDLIYSASSNQYTVKDLNLGARACQTAASGPRDPESITPCFTLASEGNRPVFIPRTSPGGNYNPRSTPLTRLYSSAFDRVYYNDSDGEGRSMSATISIDQRIGERVSAGLSYGFVNAKDNSSFSCCTSGEGFSGEQTGGNPNEVGDAGDEDLLWGTSRFERRHVVVANFLLHAPWGFNLNGIWRSQAGVPFTPVVDGDINGDGQTFNDRVFVSRDLQFRTGANGILDLANLDLLLSRYECLAEQLNQIAKRNSCTSPWWHSLDLRVSKEFNTLRGQRAELLVDLFNVLNGLNKDWGRYMQVFGGAQNLLRAESFDQATGKVVYSVNYFPATDTSPERGFAVTGPAGFDPFQFQAQIGVRYRF